ncbi:MAG: GCN5-related N-acetyltransferase [Phycisphaerales bacterium]|nr:GCN5-related N-acetyltransferase [Phycisphaerales bacterium]
MTNSATASVREGGPADIDVIWALLRKKAEFDRWLGRLEATPQKLAEALTGPRPLLGVLLAEIDGTAVGFASYYFTYSTYLAKRCVWIDDLYVDEPARNRGVGRALLREMVTLAKREECGRIEWVTAAGNEKAIGFYERIGARVRTSTRLCRMDTYAMANL